MKTLKIDNIECCLECPMYKMNIKEGFFYCSHIEAQEDHVLKRFDGESADFELLDGFLPDWCPLPDMKTVSDWDGWNGTHQN